MTKQKIVYNVNVCNSRVEQFDTLEEAQDFINKKCQPYITKSTYECDCENCDYEDCDFWYGCEDWAETKEQGL